METIKDQVRKIVGNSCQLRSPVYQSNNWWLACDEQVSFDSPLLVTKYRHSCYVYKNCRIIQKITVGSRQYTEIRAMEAEKSTIRTTLPVIANCDFLAAFYSKPFRDGKQKYEFTEKDIRNAITEIFA
jgi:hypothetical protein